MLQPSPIKFPGSVRLAAVLISICLLGYLFYIASAILAPLAASLLIALLLLPIDRWLERKHIPRTPAILLCILLVVSALAGLIWFFSSQILGLQEQLPMFQKKGMALIADLQSYIQKHFGVHRTKQMNYFKDGAGDLFGSGSDMLGSISSFTGSLVTVLGLMPIYIFFILYYRDFFHRFLTMIFPVEKHKKMEKVSHQIEEVSQAYIVGLFLVIVVVAVLNIIGLLILGIDNAVFFGVLASVLAIIPYIGIFIGSIFPAAIALVTKDSAWYAVGVVAVMGFVQFLEGNFITPNIVGSRVSVNPFAAVLALIVGGTLWGAPGMIMAIPFTAILKVVFDNVDRLKPLGFIIGEPQPEMVQGPPNAIEEAAGNIVDAINKKPDPDELKINRYDVEEPTPKVDEKGNRL